MASKSLNYIIAFDVEGPILNPAIDFAWLSLKKFAKEFYEKVKLFDEYDDLRWVYERDKNGHSTGAMPLISLCACICKSITDEALLQLAKKSVIENLGTKEVLDWLKEKEIPVYFVTSSYPAVSLIEGYRHGIKSSHIYCSGYQLSEEKAKYFNFKRDLTEELRERSPVSKLKMFQTELSGFLGDYLQNCSELRSAYIKNNVSKIETLKKEQELVFKKIREKELREELTYLLYEEKGIMGSHNKKRVLQSISTYENIIYIGDGIVDCDALAYSKYGISLNCTNDYALLSSKINVATNNIANIIPIISEIIKGNFNVNKIKNDFTSDEIKIFSNNDIKNNLPNIKNINNFFKSILRENTSLFDPVVW
ncbi:MAG: hypothetical protein HY929_09155 [Euryarchaeota archaeon]|nr:hypothetical protein [Euryarchaeota archaeon]